MKKNYFLLISLLIVLVVFFLEMKDENIKRKKAFDNLNLKLIGIVDTVDKGKNFHGFGIIRLKIISSNIIEYDPRSKQEFYFCVIKNNIAEMYDHTSGTFKGDTLIYDTEKRLGAFLRSGKKYDQGTISINTDANYFNYIRQKTIFK